MRIKPTRSRDYRQLDLWRLMEYTRLDELTGRHRIAQELLEARADDRVLEIGCATGYWANLYLRHRAATVFAMDIDREDISRAQQASRTDDSGHVEPRFLVASAEHLPFQDDNFSLVYCMDVLEHVARPEMAASEASRVLAPGGRLLVTVPGKWPFDRLDPHWPEHRHYSLDGVVELFPSLNLVTAHQTGLLWSTFWGTYVRGAMARLCRLVPGERRRAILLKRVNILFSKIADLDCRLNYKAGSALSAILRKPTAQRRARGEASRLISGLTP